MERRAIYDMVHEGYNIGGSDILTTAGAQELNLHRRNVVLKKKEPMNIKIREKLVESKPARSDQKAAWKRAVEKWEAAKY